jgi:pyruvate formate lyase activating enzyme
MIRFASMVKTSLNDYPNEICTTLFTQGCNFHCPYCHNKDLVDVPLVDVPKTSSTISEKEVFKHLKTMQGKITGVCISGGEPLLWANDLKLFILKLKELGLKVKLDTNGSFPDKLKEMNVDYISMDIKTDFGNYVTCIDDRFRRFTFRDRVELVNDIRDSIEYIISSGIDYEFRTTVVPFIIDEKGIDFICRKIKGAKRYNLQQFRNCETLDERFKTLEPYPIETLEKMRDIILSYGMECTIKGV